MRQDVYNEIERERNYQDQKWGTNRSHQLPSWLLIMKSLIQDAEDAWMGTKTKYCKDDILKKILQCSAVGVAALEEHGIVKR